MIPVSIEAAKLLNTVLLIPIWVYTLCVKMFLSTVPEELLKTINTIEVVFKIYLEFHTNAASEILLDIMKRYYIYSKMSILLVTSSKKFLARKSI